MTAAGPQEGELRTCSVRHYDSGHFGGLLDRADIVFLGLEVDGSISSVDGPVDVLFGCAPGTLIGRGWRDFIAPRSSGAPEQREIRIGESEVGLYELEVPDSRGRRLRALTIMAPAHGSNGEVIGLRAAICALGVSPSEERPVGDTVRTPARATTALTPRQHQVLRLLARGHGTEQIAATLGITSETARHHIRGIFSGLGVHSRLEAILEAARLGLVRVA